MSRSITHPWFHVRLQEVPELALKCPEPKRKAWPGAHPAIPGPLCGTAARYIKDAGGQREDGSYYTIMACFGLYQSVAAYLADDSMHLLGARAGDGLLRYAAGVVNGYQADLRHLDY